MSTLRRFAYAVFGVACTHLVFGAIVRISGSGMGCGPHWPKCYGHWFPPMDRPDLVIEVTHRYLASILLVSLIALTVAAWRRRADPAVGGPGGVLRSATLATALGFGAALLGAVTVKLGNTPLATVAHWTVAMSLVATVAASVVRTGGLGGASAHLGGASLKTRRGTLVAAALALLAVVLGGLTAKVPGGPVACLAFPLCGANPDVARGAVHVQSTHRVIAVLLVLHLVGLVFALRKRHEAPVIRRAAAIAMGLGVFQLLVAGAMIGMKLPPVLRSLHEATGVSLWIATFVLAYLARLASDDARDGAVIDPAPTRPAEPRDATPGLATSGVASAAPAASAHAAASATPAPVVASRVPDAAAPAGRATPVATPALAAAPLSDAYRPPAPVGRAAAPAPVAAPRAPVPPERARADEPLELPAAIEHATRAGLAAALAFHLTASHAAAALEAPARDAFAAAATVAAPEPLAEPATAMAAALAALEAGVPVSVADARVAMGASDAAEAAVAAPVVALPTSDATAAPACVAGLVTTDAPVVALVDDAVADVDGGGATMATGVEIAGRGAPPEEQDTTDRVDDRHHSAAPVTIFDRAAVADEADAVDDLYNLRALEALEAEDDAGDIVADEVPTLDEEFSRLAMASDAPDSEADIVAVPLPRAPEAPVVAPEGAYATLSTIAASRRPAMSHSIAVIVARGADF